jgi:translation initiation factor 1
MGRNNNSKGGLVWSSEHGRMCGGCGWPEADCRCSRSAHEAPTPSQGPVRVGRETKGRKGKGVTVVTGVPASPAELTALGKALKKKCGSGGTVKDGVIEIQGDHRDTVVAELQRRGFDVRRVGG